MGSTATASGTPPQVRLYYAKQAANDLVTSLQANGGVGGSGLHHVGLTSYGGTTAQNDVVLGTSSASAVHAAINGLASNGNTPFKTGMATGAANMTDHDRSTVNGLDVTHVIIFLSDGRPNPDAPTVPNSARPQARSPRSAPRPTRSSRSRSASAEPAPTTPTWPSWHPWRSRRTRHTRTT